MTEGAQADPELMQELAQTCATEIAAKADLRFYTTRDAAADLEALRQALGIDKLNLYGVSYGTRLAQVYATLYPNHVRSIVLDGVVPLDLAFGPAIGIDAQAALDRILARCAATADCNARFPKLAESLARGLAALEAEPRKVRAADPRTGLFDEVEVTREVAAQVLRLMTYSPETAALLPLIVDALGRGELDAIAGQWQIIGGELVQSMNQALSLAVICAEDVPYFDPAVVEASTKSFLRDDVPKALAATCPVWPSRPLPEGARNAFVSDIPTLLLSGENDPVTPPTYGERVLAGLTKARHLVAPGQGHNVLPRGCASRLVDQFLDTTDPQSLDAACLEHLSAPEPFLSPAGPAAPPAKDSTTEETAS
jgi:pimeloyl-ACP methyl ester carboxylesterase